MPDICRKPVYICGRFRIDLGRRRLCVDGEALAVTAKAFEVLAALVSRPGEVLTKDELLDIAWPDAVVEENNLTQQIAALRRAFNERPGDHRFIVTVPGRGYCFVAPLIEETVPTGPVQEIVFAGSETSSITIDISETAGLPFRSFSFDPASIRGSLIAAVYVVVVCMAAFVFGGNGRHAASGPRSVGVLTFRTVGTGDAQYGIGIRDTLRAKLGSLDDIAVRPSVLDSPVHDTLAAGREMNVDVVLSGSVQEYRGRIRVAVELVDVHTERIVWGQTFDDDAENLFELQDSIAVEVAVRIRGQERSSAEHPTRDTTTSSKRHADILLAAVNRPALNFTRV